MRPLKYSQDQATRRSVGRVFRIITAIWISSFLIGAPIFMGLNASDNPSAETECKLYDSNFIILSSVLSFYIPCFVLMILYYKILKVTRPSRPFIMDIYV